jgi:alpha-L-fucosidase
MDGLVTIEPMAQEFGWKAHGENIAENLNAGFKIYYTTDGTEPSAGSTEYKAPFLMGNSELKAVAILNGEKGAILQERFGLVKKGWKIADKTAQSLAIDLGSQQTVSGFAFTPQKQGGKGTVAGIIRISNDGKNWKEVERFEFGNLINDPSKRYHHFKQTVKARYVQVEAAEIAARTEAAALAGIDIF